MTHRGPTPPGRAWKNKRDAKTQRQAYGITVLKAADSRVRGLMRDHEPSIHGHKFWSSCWVMIDYLAYQGLPYGARVTEVGCGWGLAGIFCARAFGAHVVGVDADPEVFPYLHLHARLNEVEIETVTAKFEDLTGDRLAGQDLLIASDVCFWDEMADPLFELVRRAVQAGVQQVLIADPGRPPFSQMGRRCVEELGAEVKEWDTDGPARASGYLLIVGSLPLRAAGRRGRVSTTAPCPRR
ncbi:MAG: methyltransferase domain-containing protein [Candidatus Latescibacterota bacterium]